MRLRYRLFLWVAGVFCIAFTLSFFLEDHLTRTSLARTYGELLCKLDAINEEKSQEIEDYLADMLYMIQAEVDAVLQGIAKYQLIGRGFNPTNENLQNSNWLDSASLLITNRWIDFIQSTNEDTLMSEIIIDRNLLNDIYQFSVEDGVDLIALKKHEGGWSQPYIGIRVDINSIHPKEAITSPKESDEDYFTFFTPEGLLHFNLDQDYSSINLSVNLLEPFLKWVEVPSSPFFLREFVKRVKKAQAFLKAHPSAIPTPDVWENMIAERSQLSMSQLEAIEGGSALKGEAKEKRSSEDRYNQEQVEFYVKRFVEHYNKVGLIWGISALTRSNLFGKSPLSPNAPMGMGMVDLDNHCGKALLSKEVFYDQPKYSVDKAISQMRYLPKDFLTTHLDIIALPGMHRVFFGNTLKLQREENGQTRTGYLTVGRHGGSILGSLSRSTHRLALFMSDHKIISATDSTGDLLEKEAWYQIPPEELLSKSKGIVVVEGQEYFFLHIVPYKRLDLHFFIFTPKSEEFAFLDSMNQKAEQVLKAISLQMRFASIGGLLFVLIFLNNIAKRIARPITHLAEVTGAVAEGKLHEIKIPKEKQKMQRDEIGVLYQSFFEMVKGLKEKEKVRGILNKVVSKEIAEEALKGEIQLGGEEKYVTVLFADMRHFTEMTEKMVPTEVIQLVNTCMTKVADAVDQHGGVIDKYVGDEVMALFGAPIEKKDSALRAVKCAVDIIKSLKEWNQQHLAEGAIEMGIGIHTGMVVAGNMGAENRLNYTVLGSNVNLASRLCSEAKGMQILISATTLKEWKVKENVEVTPIETLVLKGFTDPVSGFSVQSYKEEGE